MALNQVIGFTKTAQPAAPRVKTATASGTIVPTGSGFSIPTVTGSGWVDVIGKGLDILTGDSSPCDSLPVALQASCKNLMAGIPGGGTQVVPGTTDPTLGVTPGEASMGQQGLAAPMLVQRNRLECPKIEGQATGVVWWSPVMGSGSKVCLPRGMAGGPLGLVRWNQPRKKAFISAHEYKMMKKYGKGGTIVKKAKTFAKAAGLHTHASHRSR